MTHPTFGDLFLHPKITGFRGEELRGPVFKLRRDHKYYSQSHLPLDSRDFNQTRPSNHHPYQSSLNLFDLLPSTSKR